MSWWMLSIFALVVVLSLPSHALADWTGSKSDTKEIPVHLKINWKALGLDPVKTKLTAPEINSFQSEAQFKPSDVIPITKSKGWLLVAE